MHDCLVLRAQRRDVFLYNPGGLHSATRFRISGAINKAGRRVENISGPWQQGGRGMPGNGRCRDSSQPNSLQYCARHTLAAAVMSGNY